MSNADDSLTGATTSADTTSASTGPILPTTTTVVDPALMEPIPTPRTRLPMYGHSYAYSLVSWGSVFVGAVIAVVIGAMLNILGVAVGVASAGAGGSDDPMAMTAGAGIWLAVSTVIGLVIGGYVAARAAQDPDHHEGALHGATVWAVSFLIAFFLTGSLASGTAFSAVQAAGSAAENVRVVDRVTGGARAAASEARDGADTAGERRVQEAGDTAARAVSGGAFWAFATMLVSLVGAMIGGTLGARHDEYSHRPRRSYPDVI